MLRRLDGALRVGFWVACGLLVGSVFMGGLHLYLADSHARSGDRREVLRPAGTSSGGKASREPREALAPIEGLNLLGAPADTSGPREGDTLSSGAFREGAVTKIEETGLNFELVGTVEGAPKYRYAVVRNLDSRRVRHLRPGDAWEAMVVRRVRPEGVLIRNRRVGRREFLPLRRSGENRLGPGPKGDGEAKTPRKVSRYQINQAIHSNMNNLLAAVKVQPVLGAGGIGGFRIEDLRGRPGRLLKRLGFREGDVIKRVNGRKIDSMDRAFKLWSQLSNRKDFRVRIQRDGKARTLEYSMVR